MSRRALRVIVVLAFVGAVHASCAGGAGNGSALNGHALPHPNVSAPLSDGAADVTTTTKVMTRPSPPEPSDEFPVWPVHAKRIEQFRREKIDPEWAPVTEAAIREQLAGLSDYVRIRLLECRCGGCMLGFLRWYDSEHTRDGFPDYPRVRWAGFERAWSADAERSSYPKHWDGGVDADRIRADRWLEVLHFLARHPRDAPNATPRVESDEGPKADPSCAGGQTDRGTLGVVSAGSRFNQLWFPKLYVPTEPVCACACSKIGVTSAPQCRQWEFGHVSCAPSAPTTHLGLPMIEGVWSCERAPD